MIKRVAATNTGVVVFGCEVNVHQSELGHNVRIDICLVRLSHGALALVQNIDVIVRVVEVALGTVVAITSIF